MLIAPDYQTPSRMEAKLRAVPLPDLTGKRVLDCGCDFGAWCFLAAQRGAADVLGLDRNRVVRGLGLIDLIERNSAEALQRNAPCRFEKVEMGREWRTHGRFDLVLMLSVYHHIYDLAGDHLPIWFWLRQQVADDGHVLWEGPVSDVDPVVRTNVSDENRKNYTSVAIIKAATVYFRPEYVGPALHEPTREVWRFWPRPRLGRRLTGAVKAGAGGATAAFEHANGRRMDEIERAVGMRPIPGSLNMVTSDPFWWDQDYYRAQVSDVVERGKGLDVEWAPRWARLYPVDVCGAGAFAFRFEGERYPERFVELVADVRLRDLKREILTLC